ncbi:TadE family protein [Neobacillus sp. SAB-20_R2A]|uniref:TadE family protein n=1 Tax=Neobacillus sp. SAB-20_R2A TaxID=3120519 RepID=UPI003C6E5600
MKSEKGQSMVETALILPILIMLLFGIVDFGRAFHAYLTLDHAGREAARLASLGKSDTDIRNKVDSSIAGLESTRLRRPVEINKIKVAEGEFNVSITLIYDFDFITPIVNSWTIPIKDTTVMRIEN